MRVSHWGASHCFLKSLPLDPAFHRRFRQAREDIRWQLQIAGLAVQLQNAVGRSGRKITGLALTCLVSGIGLLVAVWADSFVISFLGLTVIPSLKIIDQGLVDVDRFELAPLQV